MQNRRQTLKQSAAVATLVAGAGLLPHSALAMAVNSPAPIPRAAQDLCGVLQFMDAYNATRGKSISVPARLLK